MPYNGLPRGSFPRTLSPGLEIWSRDVQLTVRIKKIFIISLIFFVLRIVNAFKCRCVSFLVCDDEKKGKRYRGVKN